MADIKNIRKRNYRILLAIMLTIALVFSFSSVCYASFEGMEEKNVEEYLADMATQMYDIYAFLRNQIGIPLVILSIASCGFQVLFSVFFEGGPNPMARAMKQFVTSIIAFAALFLLPHVLGAVKDLLSASAWTPPTTSVTVPLFFL